PEPIVPPTPNFIGRAICGKAPSCLSSTTPNLANTVRTPKSSATLAARSHLLVTSPRKSSLGLTVFSVKIASSAVPRSEERRVGKECRSRSVASQAETKEESLEETQG